MQRNSSMWYSTAALLTGLLLVDQLAAQGIQPAARPTKANRGTVNRMEIYNGAARTVRYFGNNVSPGEASTLRELERSENESAFLADLQSLKMQYVSGERFMDNFRRNVQMQQFSQELLATDLSFPNLDYPLVGNNGLAGTYLTSYYSSPFFGAGFNPFLGGRFGTVGLLGNASTLLSANSLALGVGPESPLKDSLAQVIARQAIPEYAQAVDRAYDTALLRATVSPTLRVALRLPTTEKSLREQNDIRLASSESGPIQGVVMTLKSGEVLRAASYREEKDWYILNMGGGATTRIRPSEVIRIDQGPTGIVPAAGN